MVQIQQQKRCCMSPIPDQRNSERFSHEASVMLEDFRTGFVYMGTMYNFSANGMYFESDYAPRPDRKIRITVNELPGVSSPQVYIAEVQWRRPLSKNPSPYSFGIGVRYC